MSRNSKETVKLKNHEIVTRFRADQMKRKLRNKDYSMKKITDLLLRSPNSNKKRSNSHKPVLKQFNAISTLVRVPNTMRQYPGRKPVKKIDLTEVKETKRPAISTVEYYPEKPKRNQKLKPIVLRSQNELTMIGIINKRKRTEPRKGVSRTPSPELKTEKANNNPSPLKDKSLVAEVKEPTIEELIRLTETEGLTDEDLTEILTCPSPVWWEASCGLDEDPIIRNETEADAVNDKNSKNCNENKIDEANEPELKQKDEKFIKKKNVLENLLTNIKRIKKTNETSDNEPKEDANNPNATKLVDKKIINLTYKELLEIRERKILKAGASEDNAIEKQTYDLKDTAKVAAQPVINKESIEEPNETNEDLGNDNKVGNSEESNVNKNVVKNSRKRRFSTEDMVGTMNDITDIKHSKIRDAQRESLKEIAFDSDSHGLDELENIIIPIRNEDNSKATSEEEKNTELEHRNLSRKRRHSLDTNRVSKSSKIVVGEKVENTSKSESATESGRQALEEYENIAIPIKDDFRVENNVIIFDSPRTSESDKGTEHLNVEKNEIPTNLPPLKHFALTNSPTTDKNTSESEDVIDNSSYVSNQDGYDTISDTNVRFLTDDQESEDDTKTNSNDSTQSEKKEDLVVVYKIIDQNERPNAEKSKLEEVLKKSTSQNGGKELCAACRERTKIKIRVSNSDNECIFYCSKCSSVIKAESCVCEVEKDSNDHLVCQICLRECCCEGELKIHVTNHIGTM